MLRQMGETRAWGRLLSNLQSHQRHSPGYCVAGSSSLLATIDRPQQFVCILCIYAVVYLFIRCCLLDAGHHSQSDYLQGEHVGTEPWSTGGGPAPSA